MVSDFNLPTAKVFTGSSNLSPSGERGNGDHLKPGSAAEADRQLFSS